MPQTFTLGSVTSRDGTEIGFRRAGSGPPLVLVHGGLLAAQHLVGLASLLAADFDVVVPDRRGRGTSGPYREGPGRIVDQEAADLRAVIEHVGANQAFGLSSGALVLLTTAIQMGTLAKVALYEPPLSIGGSAPLGWVPRYERERAAGDTAGALITGMRGLRTDPVMGRIPHIAAPLMRIVLRREKVAPGDVPIRELVPTWHYDMAIIDELADRPADFSDLRAEVLLLGGSRSPQFLSTGLDALERVLPSVRRSTLPGLGHQAPVDVPDRLAPVLAAFFA